MSGCCNSSRLLWIVNTRGNGRVRRVVFILTRLCGWRTGVGILRGLRRRSLGRVSFYGRMIGRDLRVLVKVILTIGLSGRLNGRFCSVS